MGRTVKCPGHCMGVIEAAASNQVAEGTGVGPLAGVEAEVAAEGAGGQEPGPAQAALLELPLLGRLVRLKINSSCLGTTFQFSFGDLLVRRKGGLDAEGLLANMALVGLFAWKGEL